MEGEFKINLIFNENGEKIEKMLADYILSIIKTSTFSN